MKCCYCGGRGWTWVGVASNAVREPCGPCDGRGRWHRVNWGTVGGLVAVLFSLALAIAIIHLSVSLAHGQTAGSMTLKEFRQQPSAREERADCRGHGHDRARRDAMPGPSAHGGGVRERVDLAEAR